MKFDKGLALVASITTKTGGRLLNGKVYSHGVHRVSKKTAMAAVEDGGFIVNWDEGFRPDANAEKETELPEATPETIPEPPATPEPVPEPELPVKTTEEPAKDTEESEDITFDKALEEYDALKVADTPAYVARYDDKELLKFLVKNARWKGSQDAATDRLEELE